MIVTDASTGGNLDLGYDERPLERTGAAGGTGIGFHWRNEILMRVLMGAWACLVVYLLSNAFARSFEGAGIWGR